MGAFTRTSVDRHSLYLHVIKTAAQGISWGAVYDFNLNSGYAAIVELTTRRLFDIDVEDIAKSMWTIMKYPIIDPQQRSDIGNAYRCNRKELMTLPSCDIVVQHACFGSIAYGENIGKN